MKRLFIFLICPLIFASCSYKKGKEPEPLPPNPPVSSEYFPLKVGNYWVYQHYHFDTNGNLIYDSRIDSIYISKDTMISGQKYYKLERDKFLGSVFFPTVIADSNAYLLSYPGFVILSPDTTEIFEDEGENYHLFSQSCRRDSAVDTQAGYFPYTITFKTYLEGKNDFKSGYRYYVFAKNVGIIDRQLFYSNSPETPVGLKLIRYHVQLN